MADYGIGSVLSGLTGALSGMAANSTNIQLARESRDWQELMYNRYYSPQAMMAQYEKAGLNPYMLGQNSGGVGQSAMPQTSFPTVQPVNPMSGIDSAVSTLLQQQQLSINAKNASADYALKLSEAVSETYKTGGSKAVKELFSVLEPSLQNIDFDQGLFAKEALSRIRLQDEESLLKNWQREFSKTFDPKRAELEFHNLEASTSELMSRVDLNKSNLDLNDAYIKRSVSEIARNFAEAFYAKKVGEYYEVSAGQLQIINGMLGMQFFDQLAEFNFNRGVRGYKNSFGARNDALNLFKAGLGAQGVSLGIQNNNFLQNFKEYTGAIGNMFKVNFGLSNTKANIRSFGKTENVTNSSYIPIQGFGQ